MKKILIILSLLCVTVVAFSQNALGTLGANLEGVVVTDLGNSKFRIEGNFVDPTQLNTGQNLAKNDALWSPPLNPGDTCRRYVIDTIYNKFSGYVIFGITDNTGQGTPSTANSYVMRETPNRTLAFNPSRGLDQLIECISKHYSMQVDTINFAGGAGNTSIVSSRDDATYTHDDGTGNTTDIDVRDSISTDAGNLLSVGTDGRPYLDTLQANQVVLDKGTCLFPQGTTISSVLSGYCGFFVDSIAVDSINPTQRVVSIHNTVGEVSRDTFTVGGASTDELVKVSANDTNAGYLEDKIVAGNNVTVTTLNDGANEQFQISAGPGYNVYELEAGAMWVVATDSIAGLSFTRNNSTGEWVLTIPAGVDVKGGWVVGDATSGDGNNDVFFNFDYDASVTFNQNNGNSRRPQFEIHNTNGTASRASMLMKDNTLTYGMSAVGSGDIEIGLVDAAAFFSSFVVTFVIP